MFLAAVVQLNGSSNVERNFAQLEELVSRAARYGASLVATPENTNFLGPHADKVRLAEPLDGATGQRLSAIATRHGVHLLVGSVNENSAEAERCYNTSVLYGPDGARLASYRKLHLFDVDVADGVRFKESKTTVPGDHPTVVSTALGTLGLSICYDLRFPELYRRLCDDGAQILTVPSAFTLMTGKDHWETLLRTRAIENQAYVLAPAQWGHHDDEGLRHSYGHAMIVDPWGHVVARASDGVGLALAEIDLDLVTKVRRGMPMSEHRRL